MQREKISKHNLLTFSLNLLGSFQGASQGKGERGRSGGRKGHVHTLDYQIQTNNQMLTYLYDLKVYCYLITVNFQQIRIKNFGETYPSFKSVHTKWDR